MGSVVLMGLLSFVAKVCLSELAGPAGVGGKSEEVPGAKAKRVESVPLADVAPLLHHAFLVVQAERDRQDSLVGDRDVGCR